MTLAIDMIGTHQGSGTKTYNINFCQYISKHNIDQKIFIFITKDYLENIDINKDSNIEYKIKSAILTNIFLRILWMQFFLPFELKKLKVNNLYSPMNISPLILKIFNIKLTLGLHSNLPWVYFSLMPGNFLRNFVTKFIMQLSINVCDKLIVDSEFAKKEIVQILKLKDEKVHVVYLGIDKKYLTHNSNEYILKNFDYSNYIISVLSCVKYHNIMNILKAFKLFKDETKSKIRFVFILQILDKEYFSEINSYVFKNFEKGEIIFFHNLNNNYLVNLYKKANLYIFSSYCEVFGLTSLEAMSQSCPVLISNASALPEINDNAAEYFDPDDINQIMAGMEKITFNQDLRVKLVNKGNEHFKKFNWLQTVNKTIEILNI
jgi:glycosyltransferase involved in cell wall biosynthesis